MGKIFITPAGTREFRNWSGEWNKITFPVGFEQQEVCQEGIVWLSMVISSTEQDFTVVATTSRMLDSAKFVRYGRIGKKR